MRQTKIFVILGNFSPFQPPDNTENQNFKVERSTWIYYHFKHLHHIWQSYDVWFLRYRAWRTEFFVILDHFLPIYPSNNLKNQNFEKLEKTPEDIIILHKCTKNHHHMLYCSWNKVYDRCNFYFSFWAIFCPFTSLTAQKIKIFKKWKRYPEISSFYNGVLKIMIIFYIVPEILRVTNVIIFHFEPFFALATKKVK